jgi:hypothetical protein
MIFQTLQRRDAFFEQDICAGSLEVAPQGVDREIFLVFKMIEKGTFGNAGSIGYVLNRTPVKAVGMQGIYRTARQFLA